MKSILLIGAGHFGYEVAKKLHELRHEVMVIDRDEERVDDVLPYVTSAQIGDSTDEVFLKSLGVRNFDLCIVTISSDFQSSLETTSLLKDLGAGYVVSRAERDVHTKFLLRNGADEVVNPEKQLASWTAIRYSSDHIFDYIELDDNHAIIEVSPPKSWAGKTIGQVDIRKRFNISVLGLKREDALNMEISADTRIGEGETMLVLGKYKDVEKCFHI